VVERIIRGLGIPLVYDFDDAIYLGDTSASNARMRFLKFPSKTAMICRLATHVVVGNDMLAAWARQHNPNVTIIPTTIDTDKYMPATGRRGDGPLTVGWSGSHTTAPYLESIKPVLREVAQREPFQLRVIGAPRFQIDGVPFESLPWRAESEVADLLPMEVGLMPIPDSEWGKGKCALKALQYMALGTPAVVSPVGANTQVVRHGVNGLHASTDAEWVEQLVRILQDRALRRRLGKAARQTVVDEYSNKRQAPRLLEVLVSAARTRGSARTVAAGYEGATHAG
jgi:glycosyltransferase involved in cell wall biosynthesis